MSMRVLAPGLLTSFQDLGRYGHAASGVGRAGAMDAVALRIANALVGNQAHAAGLEITLRGPRLQIEEDCVLAVAGADIDSRCNGEALPNWRPWLVRRGTQMDFGAVRAGARAYLAVAGGFAVESVLASRSTDINAALGPLGGRALASGDVVTIGSSDAFARLHSRLSTHASGRQAVSDVTPVRWSVDPSPWFAADIPAAIAIERGAHFGYLDERSQHALFGSEFRVAMQSNRVGFRLEGPVLTLQAPLELVSEGVAPGTVQLPAGGQPIILMAEAPTTGGYPRIAHVAEVDLAALAQCKPGDRLRFVETSLADAQSRYLERERMLHALFQTIDEHLAA